MNRLVPFSPLLLATLVVSCESRDPGGDGYTSVDSAGIEIIESWAPASADDPLRIESEPFVQIGREEPGPYQFALVGFGALLDDGRIAVAAAGAQEVRVFSSSGEHEITLGRAGEGPGEFLGVGRVFELAGDSVAAFDGRLDRTTIFSITTGEYRSIQSRVEGNYGVFGRVKDGPFLLYSPGGSYRPDLSPGPQWIFTNIVAMDPADGSSRVVANLPDRWRAVRADGNAPMPRPLRYAIQAVESEGFYWATPDRYEIKFFDAEGRVRRLIRRPIAPRAVDPAMISEAIEEEVAEIRESQGEARAAEQRTWLEEQVWGDYLPLFQEAFVDGEDRLWVGSVESLGVGFASQWSVFSRTGRWLGDVSAPDRLRIVDANHDMVMGIWQDDLDVPYVQLHRLVGGLGED